MKTSREALLDVAFRLFLERGYDKVSMNDLVAASGVSKGAFHHYFHRKPELFEACLQQFFVRFLPSTESLDARSVRTEELVQQLIDLQEGLVNELGRLGLDSVAYWRFILNLPMDWRAQLNQGLATLAQTLESAFARDQAAGLLLPQPDARVLARTLMSLLEGHSILASLALPPVTVRELVGPWLGSLRAAPESTTRSQSTFPEQ